MEIPLVVSIDLGSNVIAVALNRAAKRNAMSAELLRQLEAALRSAADNPLCRVIVLAARGKLFCAGADVADPRVHPVGEPGSPEQLLVACQDVITSARQPVIARVQGDVIGGGVGLVAAADIVVADQAAGFIFTEARLGVAATLAARTVIPRVGQAVALRMMLLGERLAGNAARDAGLVSISADTAELDVSLANVLRTVLQSSPAGLTASKMLAQRMSDPGRQPDTAALYQLTSELIVSDEALEGGAAASAKRSPSWALAGPTAEHIAAMLCD